MLRSKNIIVGRFYVNKARKTARQILEVDQHIIVFYNYHLDNGNSSHSPSQCTKRDFIRWADHEATPTELASLRYRQTEDLLHVSQSTNKEKIISPGIAPTAKIFHNDQMKGENYILD